MFQNFQPLTSKQKVTNIKGPTPRFSHLEEFCLNFSIHRLHSELILSILNHPYSFMVYYDRFGVLLSHFFFHFLQIKSKFVRDQDTVSD